MKRAMPLVQFIAFLALALGGCLFSPLRPAAYSAEPGTGVTNAPCGVEIHKDLSYYDGPGRDLEGFHTLDVYAPKKVQGGPRSALRPRRRLEPQ